ncbi:MAG: SMC-Scp complex subunit ScpB [Pirellulales bacterium]
MLRAMGKQPPNSPAKTTAPPASSDSAAPRESPLSLSRLREAFAAMLGGPARSEERGARSESSKKGPAVPPPTRPVKIEICPRSVVESILFVGRPDNGAISARELAAAMRGVSPAEVAEAVAELNAVYDADQTPYRIEQSAAGYRLAFRPEFERMRDKFYGRVKEAKLSPAVLEVLSVLAYNQPATAEQLAEIRGEPCGGALAQLVRRKLVRLERTKGEKTSAIYTTTERFLRLFGLESLEALPRSEELQKA